MAACGGIAQPAAGAGEPEPHPVAAPSFTRPVATLPGDGGAPVEVEPSRADNVAPAPARSPLENAAALGHFFEAAARLDDGGAQDDVRVLFYGDSHTASDWWTGVVRRTLQARFADGGRGFVSLGKPGRWYVQEGIRGGMTRDYTIEHTRLQRGAYVGDGLYGLTGLSIATRLGGARAWTDVAVPFTRLEVAYLEQPGGGSFDLYVDGTKAARVTTRAADGVRGRSGYRALELPDGPHKLLVQAVGDGPVRIFGASLDRSTHGVVLDALGINGSRASELLRWNEAHFTEQVRHRAPALVVLAYGTNESSDDTSPAVYERQLVDVVGRVARAAPGASCLLIGPPDRALRTSQGWLTSPKVVEIIETQRRVAQAAGCAFYDQMAAMGGADTIHAWTLETPPRASPDHVHLTRDGYAFSGTRLTAEVLAAYGAWRSETGKPALPPRPLNAPPPPPTPPTQTPAPIAGL